MRNQAIHTAAVSLFGCAAIYALAHFLANAPTTDFSTEDRALRRVLARAAGIIAAPLQRCYVDNLDPAGRPGETAADREARLMFAGLACDGGLVLSGG